MIIDIRGNEGGNDPEQIYSYIARQYEVSTDRHKGHNEFIQQSDNGFEGTVIVLANERTISAQETFVSICKNNHRALIIGQPTSGCYKRLCGGKKHRLKLPNSRHEIRIPMYPSLRIYTENVNYTEGQGIPPDVIVHESIEDVLAGKDGALEFALNRIARGL